MVPCLTAGRDETLQAWSRKGAYTDVEEESVKAQACRHAGRVAGMRSLTI